MIIYIIKINNKINRAFIFYGFYTTFLYSQKYFSISWKRKLSENLQNKLPTK